MDGDRLTDEQIDSIVMTADEMLGGAWKGDVARRAEGREWLRKTLRSRSPGPGSSADPGPTDAGLNLIESVICDGWRHLTREEALSLVHEIRRLRAPGSSAERAAGAPERTAMLALELADDERHEIADDARRSRASGFREGVEAACRTVLREGAGTRSERAATIERLRSLTPPSAERADPGVLAEWYEADGSVTMLPAEEVTRRRKAAAVVLGKARAFVDAKGWEVEAAYDALDAAVRALSGDAGGGGKETP
jgi:hypothetical protein